MSGIDSSQPDDTPAIFAAHIRYVLDREFERADRGTGRAETVFKSQVAILTVAIGIAAFVYRDGHGLSLDGATAWILGGSSAFAVFSLIAAALGQSIAVRSKLTDAGTLQKMISPEYWHGDANALYVVTCRDRDSVEELRKSNNQRAAVIDLAVLWQVTSVVLAVVAIGYEVASRMSST